jgi:hypothetical protein
VGLGLTQRIWLDGSSLSNSSNGRKDTQLAGERPKARSRGILISIGAVALAGAAVGLGLLLRGALAGAAAESFTLSASKSGLLGVRLRWAPPSGAVDHFEIARDDEVIADALAGGRSTFVDEVASLETEHRYTVVAVGADGDRTESSVARITIPTPPLDQAQFSGLFGVGATYTKKVDFTDPTKEWVELWEVFGCSSGPCETVQLRITAGDDPGRYLGLPSPTGQLVRSGLEYTGRLAEGAFTICKFDQKRAQLEDVATIAITIIDAEVQEGTWRATGFEGTVELFDPGAGNCGISAYSADLVGRLIAFGGSQGAGGGIAFGYL